MLTEGSYSAGGADTSMATALSHVSGSQSQHDQPRKGSLDRAESDYAPVPEDIEASPKHPDYDDDDTESDDSTERFLASVDHMIPIVKIEVAGLNLMRVLLGIMWGLGLFNLAVSAGILGAMSTIPDDTIGAENKLWNVIYKIEGLMRTIGVAFLFFLLLSFPQRIIREYIKRPTAAFRTQILIVVVIVLMSVGPGYSIYEVVSYWQGLDSTADGISVEQSDGPDGVEQLTILSLLARYSPRVIEYNTVTSMLITSFLFILFAGVFHMQYHTAYKVEQSLRPEIRNQEAAFDDFFDTKTVVTDYGADDEEEAGDNAASRAVRAELSLKFKYMFLQTRARLMKRVYHWIKRYRKFSGGFPFHVQFTILVYLVLSLSLPLSLDYHPSIIPIVGVITVGRVCSVNVTDFLPMNFSVVEPIEIDGETRNLTINMNIISSAETDELGICSPSQLSPMPFRRALSISILGALELYLFILIWFLSWKTKVFLTSTSYAHTRREILGYHFFRHIAIVCWGFIMLVGILSTTLNPLPMYYMEKGVLQFDEKNNTFTTSFYLDPLFEVGVNVGTIGYGAYLAMVVTWIFLLAFANLPADSQGLHGFFTGAKVEPGEEALATALHQEDFLILINKESEVKKLLSLKRREERSNRFKRSLLKHRSALNLISTNSSGMHVGDGAMLYIPPLWMQIGARVLVLETEILNFHFMHLSYTMAGKMIDRVIREHRPLTREEKESLIENKAFRLVEHVTDIETDTHAMVFASSDRVVVAFRGSVSKANWQTDFDSAEVVCEYAKDVEPDLSGVPPAGIPHAKKVASLPPKVHGGFVKAYETVRARLTAIVSRELAVNDDSKALFITGHSLGGGLAIICSMDLAVTLKLPKERISVTTWGAPKVGTYSFHRRFNRVCPSAHRFCMADDPITKLPMDSFLQSVRLNGWWHCGTEILLNEVGNMLIRPSPIERFMLRQVPLGTPQAHLRMTYATALMLWVVRSNSDFQPDWWPSVVTLFYKNAPKRLKPVAKNLRVRLLDSLLKAGVTYTHNNRMVRDMIVDTSFVDEEDSGYEYEVTSKITDLLIAYRLEKEHDFDKTLKELMEIHRNKKVFRRTENNEPILPKPSVDFAPEPGKRKQDAADLRDSAQVRFPQTLGSQPVAPE